VAALLTSNLAELKVAGSNKVNGTWNQLPPLFYCGHIFPMISRDNLITTDDDVLVRIF
jgi:hypothetical protein